uniref:Cobalamin-binding protein n=1 Tax=Archaeoglobus fulgidus TaxID=2234 RepID=A0A7J2TKU3_ARCFL
MKRAIILILLPLFLSFCVSNDAPDGNSEYIVDDTNYTVRIEDVPKRIVSLAPSNTEILFAIGAGEQVVGVTDYCNYPPEVMELKKKGILKTVGGYSTVSIERVIALKPDLVIGAYGNGLQTIEIMRALGLKVVAFNPKNLSDVMESIVKIGKLTGHEKEAIEVVREMEKKIEAVRKSVSGKERVKVAHILWHDPIFVSGRNTFIDELIQVAGGENAFNFDGWRAVSVENIVSANPEVIVVSSGSGMGKGEDIIYSWVLSDPLLRDVEAVKNGKVFVIDADIISRPSHRLCEAAIELAKFIHGVNPLE